MSNIRKLISELESKNQEIADDTGRHSGDTLVGVRMEPAIFHSLMQDPDAHLIVAHYDKGYNTLYGYPIEIKRGFQGYELIQIVE